MLEEILGRPRRPAGGGGGGGLRLLRGAAALASSRRARGVGAGPKPATAGRPVLLPTATAAATAAPSERNLRGSTLYDPTKDTDKGLPWKCGEGRQDRLVELPRGRGRVELAIRPRRAGQLQWCLRPGGRLPAKASVGLRALGQRP